MRQRIELLSPAGDLERLKIAILYGADAVYIGGKKFSLRSRQAILISRISKRQLSLLMLMARVFM